MDQTDRLAAATIVAGMLTGEHTLLGDRSFKNWPSIAKAWFDCARLSPRSVNLVVGSWRAVRISNKGAQNTPRLGT